jgi:hypothetical protein
MHNFKHVVENLYRGSAPNDKDVVKLHNMGITKIVSLDKADGEKIDRICKKLKINHVIIPLDMSKQSLLLLDKLNLQRLLLSEPTYVHCKFGKDRTGLIIALLKVKYLGYFPEDAIKEAESFGFGRGVDPHIVNIMKKMIRSYSKDMNSLDDETVVQKAREDSLDIHSPHMLSNIDMNTWEPPRSYPFGLTYRPFTYLENQDEKTENAKEGVPQIGKLDNDYSDYGSGFIFDSNAYH